MKYFLSILLLLLTFSATASPATELNDLLTTMKTLRAGYVQTTVDPKSRDQKKVQGTALLARPNQFRWEVEQPYQQSLISDGEKLWIYDKDLDQVTVQALQNNIKDTPALLLAGDPKAVTDFFKVKRQDTGFGEQTFHLVPLSDDSLVRDVTLTFKGSVISRMVLVDSLHQVVTLEFSQIKINETLPQDLFRFTPPPGVDVIGQEAP